MGPSSRRLVATLIRIGLVVLAIALVGGYFARKMPGKRHMRLQSEAPPPDALGPGDLRIFNTDSAVELVLQGDKILAGLSPKTVAKVKSDLAKSETEDTSGLGGSISQMVKKSVAGAIGMHAVFPLSRVRDIHYDGERMVIEWKEGGEQELFGSTRVDGEKVSGSFHREDAERFVAAVRERLRLPPTPPTPPE